MSSQKLPALTAYLLMRGMRSFLFWTAFITGAIYYIQGVGFDPLQLVLVGTALELTAFACEIPTGVIADLYGRKRSVILGTFLIGVAFVLQGAVARFYAVLLAQVFYGLGWTLISGAEDAWLADEIGTERLARAYLRGKQVALAASFAGVIASVALASIALNVPFLISGCGLIGLAALLIGIMPEANFHPASHASIAPWKRMTSTLAEGLLAIRLSPVLILILGMTLLYGVSREGIDRLWEVHILSAVAMPDFGNLKTVAWFGVINALAMLAALAASLLLQSWIHRLEGRPAIIWLIGRYVLLAASILWFALSRSFISIVAAYVLLYALREIGDAVQSAWVNRSIDSNSRATVLSTISQMDALGQAGGGPVIGAIGTRIGLRASMLLASAMLVPVLALLARAFQRASRRS